MTLADPVVFFTGAGISVAAGLPTYRGAGGLYEGTDREPPNATDATERRIASLWARFTDRLVANQQVRPTAAHEAIADLATRLDVTVITQNVDGLHSASGVSDVIELHGSLRRVRCLHCSTVAGIPDASSWVRGVPLCSVCDGPCRPDIVLFGEHLPRAAMERGFEAMDRARTIVAVGTSGSVFPAALLIAPDANPRAERIWINPAPPPHRGWSWIADGADAGVAAVIAGDWGHSPVSRESHG